MILPAVPLQTIYAETIDQASEKAKRDLSYKKMKKTMERARVRLIPKTKDNLLTIAGKFEAGNVYPTRYQVILIVCVAVHLPG